MMRHQVRVDPKHGAELGGRAVRENKLVHDGEAVWIAERGMYPRSLPNSIVLH